MDVERAMEFIVRNLAAVTAAQQQAEVRAARMDRRMNGLQTLMKVGMRKLAKLEQAAAAQRTMTEARFAELAVEMKDLAAAQKRTDRKFDRWLDSLKGGNGKRHRS